MANDMQVALDSDAYACVCCCCWNTSIWQPNVQQMSVGSDGFSGYRPKGQSGNPWVNYYYYCYCYYYYIPLTAFFLGHPGKPFCIILAVASAGPLCKSFAPHSKQITMPVPRHSVLQAGCPFCRPDHVWPTPSELLQVILGLPKTSHWRFIFAPQIHFTILVLYKFLCMCVRLLELVLSDVLSGTQSTNLLIDSSSWWKLWWYMAYKEHCAFLQDGKRLLIQRWWW